MNYEVDTKRKYQSEQYARYYAGTFQRFTFRNLRPWLVAWHEKQLVAKALSRVARPVSTLADIPCGTGKLCEIFRLRQVEVIAGDISAEMIHLAAEHYTALRDFRGFVRLDAAHCPLKHAAVDAVIALRLMHRVPEEIRSAMLTEFARVSKEYIIISYGVTSPFQRLRRSLRKLFATDLSYRDLAVSYAALHGEIAKAGLHLVATYRVLWALSCEVILVLAKG